MPHGEATMTDGKLKLASYHVRATMTQSLRWKAAAQQAGHQSVGTWIPEAVNP